MNSYPAQMLLDSQPGNQTSTLMNTNLSSRSDERVILVHKYSVLNSCMLNIINLQIY